MRLSNDEALRLLNALRSGTTPLNNAKSLITGRDQECHQFSKDLTSLTKGSGLVRLVVGDYGMGKSQLVNTYKQMALEEDFITASFQINNGFRLNKIDDLYYAIMHNLFLKHQPQEKSSFNEIFDLWIANLQTAPIADRKRYEVNTVCQEISKYNMNFARAFLSFMRGRIQRNTEMINVTGAWLTGERNIPFELKAKYGLTGSVDKANTLDFLKAFIKLITLLDYQGLVVFIDELDLVLNDRSDLRQTAYNNLKHLTDLAASGEMPGVMFVFSGTNDVIAHEEKGILSCPPLAQRMGLTPNNTFDGRHQNVIALTGLDASALFELTSKIVKLYTQVHGKMDALTDHELYVKALSDFGAPPYNTRQFITTLIRHLDQK